MRIVDRGVLNREAGDSDGAVSTFPALACLPDGTILATYRTGSGKDSDDGNLVFRRSIDNGQSWSQPASPLSSTFNGRRGSLWLGYVTPLSDQHLLLAALWVDREAFPGRPLFNEATEGCLPMQVLLADSFDNGERWSEWHPLPVTEDLGPPSLTNPILRLPCGRLIASIESNKRYEDESPWLQRVAYLSSDDGGATWSEPSTVADDPTGRIFNWDQRAGVTPDGSIVTFTWTYDRVTRRYLNVHRRMSFDKGFRWTRPEDLGFADQASVPAVLADGRVFLAWVNRFISGAIRARIAERPDAHFPSETEIVLFECPRSKSNESQLADSSTGELLTEMGVWNYGLPFAHPLKNGDVMVLHYEPTPDGTQIAWNRIEV